MGREDNMVVTGTWRNREQTEGPRRFTNRTIWLVRCCRADWCFGSTRAARKNRVVGNVLNALAMDRLEEERGFVLHSQQRTQKSTRAAEQPSRSGSYAKSVAMA